MARYVFHHHRRNPEIFGEEIGDVGLKAVGLAATALVNDQLIAPVAKPLTSGFGATGSKVADAVTTVVSAWGIGEIVRIVDGQVGRDLRQGGLILAAGRLISAFIPGFQISAQVPQSVSSPFAAPAPPAAQVNAPQAPPLPAGGRYAPAPGYGSLAPTYAAGL